MEDKPAKLLLLPNDAHLIQLVRGALGRADETKSLPRINVSSCKLVVTLHGAVPRGSKRCSRNRPQRLRGAGCSEQAEGLGRGIETAVFPRDGSRVSRL